jgi:hypothetical protein
MILGHAFEPVVQALIEKAKVSYFFWYTNRELELKLLL